MPRVLSILAWIPAMALLFPAAPGAGAPEVGREQIIDHHFRYPTSVGETRTCAIAPADSLVLLAYHNGGSKVVGYRRGAAGQEIDANPTVLADLDGAGTFALAPCDGDGWKLAFVDGGLFLRNLDRATLRPTSPDLPLNSGMSGSALFPVMAWTGERHLAAWIQDEPGRQGLWLARVRPDLTREDTSAVWIADGVRRGAFALAADARGGLVIWVDAELRLLVRALGADGLPLGTARAIAELSWGGRFDPCVGRAGDGWLAAWIGRGTTSLAQLDADGAVVSLIHPELDPGDDGASLALAVDPSGAEAALIWRGQRDGVAVSRIGLPLSGTTVRSQWLDQNSPYLIDVDPQLARSLAVDYARGEVVALWTSFLLQTAAGRDGAGPDRGAGEGAGSRMEWNSFLDPPVRAQWLSAGWEPLHTEPVVVSQMTQPEVCGLHFGAGRFYYLMQDAATDEFLHFTPLDPTAHVTGEGWRWATGATCEGGIFWSDCSRIGRIGVRSGPVSALVGFGFGHTYHGEIGTFDEDSRVHFVQVDSTGSVFGGVAVRVDRKTELGPPPLLWPATASAAVGASGKLVAYSVPRDADGSGVLRVVAALSNSAGQEVRRWSVSSEHSCSDPVVAAMGDDYLLVWLEASSPPILRRAVVTPQTPGDEIVGEPLIPDMDFQAGAVLIPGDNQFLCVFPAIGGKDEHKGATSGDLAGGDLTKNIYRQRLDAELRPIGPVRALCAVGWDEGLPNGIWDGRQYLVTWSYLGSGTGTLVGARVAAGSSLRDTTVFVIASGVRGSAALATDRQGTILVGYDAKRVRAIHDAAPLIWDGQNPPPDDPPEDPPPDDPPPDDPPPDDPPPDDPPPPEPPLALRIGGINPNPGRGVVHLDLQVPSSIDARIEIFDAAGRLVRAERLAGGVTTGGWTWNGLRSDGSAAPAGPYYLSIHAGDRHVTRRATLMR